MASFRLPIQDRSVARLRSRWPFPWRALQQGPVVMGRDVAFMAWVLEGIGAVVILPNRKPFLPNMIRVW